ncbi:bifunctional DNA primase/polymerase [Alicyclobacillus tolerans]|uniref:bifunctional DNA primase/polymerase n=1 Tax=Alicyclobacillus tolerans TaxID=90970 RepID=UPI001F2B17A7|nr:bifunctional DNA primase/polymerase [Alicyclobacillus tolerans]MCF8567730.1 bifunctional DNA primase/polymerase [Alicyclobacillus tolerans]
MAKEKAPDVAGATGSESNNHSSSVPQMERFERAYMRFGWAIFPVKSGDKTPATTHGCHDATIDSEVFQKLCKGPHNDGLATGLVSGVWVLDVDVRHGGDKSLHQLIDRYGSLPFTVQSRTQSGGQHIFFKWDPDHPVASKKDVFPGIDTRGNGGYVVIPPSKGLEGDYEWIVPPIRNEIASAPTWLYELLESSKLSESNCSRMVDGDPRLNELRKISEAKMVDGQYRNGAVARIYGYLISHGVDPYIARQFVMHWNAANIEPLEQNRVEAAMTSVLRAELRKKGGIGA